MNANKNKQGEIFGLHPCSFAFIGGLILLLGGCASHSGNSNAQTPTAVETVIPVRREFHTKVSAFGQLAADSRGALSLSLPPAGQVIATDVIAGQRVQRGEPLLTFETAPSARSAYKLAQSAVKAAREDLERAERLHAGKLATNAQLAAARKAFADAQAALEAQAKLGGAAAVATLKAPANGVISALLVRRGQRVSAGTRLIDFAPAAALAARLGVDPQTASSIHKGMSVAIQPVYGSQGMPPLAGTVAMVGGAVNPQSHLVDVIATFDAPVSLTVGSALSATIETSQFTAWAVPRRALQSDAHGSYVFQVEHGRAHRVDVKVLAAGGSPVGVKGALAPHAPVITLGSHEVSDGGVVRIDLSPASHASRAAAR